MSSFVCRVCLNSNIKMHIIQDKTLLDVYEKLSSRKLHEDGLPSAMCYVCVSLLQKCRRFSEMARNHFNTFRRITYNNIPDEYQGVTPEAHMTVKHYSNSERANQVEVKHEEATWSIKEEPIGHEDLFETKDTKFSDIVGSSQNIEWPLLKEKSNQYQSFYCDACNKKCVTKSSLIKHLRIHSGKTLNTCTHTKEQSNSCDLCKKDLNQHDNLKHMLIHTGEQRHTCNVCNKSFTVSYLKIHMRVHTGERPYTCKVCNKSYTVSDNLKKHMRIHSGEKPYTCEVCNKSFTRSGDLKRHSMHVHTGNGPYTCDVCNMSYSRFGNLKKHSNRIHTGDRPVLNEKMH